MAKMNELSRAEEEAYWEQFEEYRRETLRKEGAEEMRIEILRALKEQSSREAVSSIKLGLEAAIVIVERAQR